jgi:hypothetical protein
MPGGNASLLDSNILLRLSKSDDPRHAAISHAHWLVLNTINSAIRYNPMFPWRTTNSHPQQQNLATRQLGTMQNIIHASSRA